MAEVESFTLDHTAVKAPYVRLISVEHGPNGDAISNFDLRFVQPNASAIPTGGLHTIEHLLAAILRDHLEGVIDCSPFGCRTGFHLIVWGTPSVEEVTRGLETSLRVIADDVTWEDVPGTDEKSCGNYRDHSLFSAKEWAQAVLAQGFSVDAFERKLLAD
ncbi:S-ribosylhomocysteine lyase [Schaalia sp. ZJ1691]|uniref:S-ribosylhomocysteine lyase n=1 Tax=Schaalia sp. ZJ1691 TaxID=2709404 RepID=UPI0013E9E0AB|nr:S-ribosylhomocysteine lyase [Schaalia sp. ZJ1691]